jgi:hypothetical protein
MDQATGIFATRMGRATKAKEAKAKITSTISAEDLEMSARYLDGCIGGADAMDGWAVGWVNGDGRLTRRIGH